jgi:Tfp pilus assembly protein PilF
MKENHNMTVGRASFFSEFCFGHKTGCLILIFVLSFSGIAQNDKEQRKLLKESKEYLSNASEKLQANNFPIAEADYRNAIALNPVDETGKYNLGNAYYNKTLNAEAMRRFKEAATVAGNKPEKHKAFHNLGNTFMNAKQYKEAVEAYKNALRNNPTDDETRYNLALAKKMLEEQQQNGGGDDENKDQNEEKKEDQENKEDKGNEKEGDDGDKKEDKEKGDQKDENKEGDQKEDKGKPEEKKEGEGDKEKQQQPVPGQLSPQQIKNLLEAMNNEEKKVQDKINAKKQKGAQVKSNKDW